MKFLAASRLLLGLLFAGDGGRLQLTATRVIGKGLDRAPVVCVHKDKWDMGARLVFGDLFVQRFKDMRSQVLTGRYSKNNSKERRCYGV